MPATPSMSLITWTRTARRLLSRSTRVRAEGAPVAVHYHQGASGAENVGGAITLQADLTDEVQVDTLFARARGTGNGRRVPCGGEVGDPGGAAADDIARDVVVLALRRALRPRHQRARHGRRRDGKAARFTHRLKPR